MLDIDGVPLCPRGCRMRHEHYQADRDAHYSTCPAKRRNGKGIWIFHADECPFHADCCPDKKLGYSQYLAADTNPRYFPEIPRQSKRFKTLYAERTGVERSTATEDSYHLDRCTRHAEYGLIRLTLVNCAKHAKLRWLEQRKEASAKQLLQVALTRRQIGEGSTHQPQQRADRVPQTERSFDSEHPSESAQAKCAQSTERETRIFAERSSVRSMFHL